MKEVISISKNDPTGEPGTRGPEGPKVEPFVARMLMEHAELREKITKLDVFIDGDKYKTLRQVQQDLLVAQYNVMLTYLGILEMRIKYEGVKI